MQGSGSAWKKKVHAVLLSGCISQAGAGAGAGEGLGLAAAPPAHAWHVFWQYRLM